MKDLVQIQIAPVSGVSSITEHLPNDVFHASSFMQGHNAEYLEQMYARYAADPNAVDAAGTTMSHSMLLRIASQNLGSATI